jgi:hypothetical protein
VKITTALSLLLLTVCTWTETQAQGRVSEEETVRSLDDQERTAALKRDVAALKRLWSDQFTVNAPTNKVVIGKRDVLDTFVHRGIIMGAETVRPIGDAPLAGQTVHRRFTNIWRKEAGRWRLFARHANVIPSP